MVFIWRTGSPLGRDSPNERAGFYLAFTWERLVFLLVLARLAESPGGNYIYFATKPGISKF